MKNKINFITGKTYTLAELFSEERQIIIPDLQRDYCWGNDNNTKASGKGELVSDFVCNLILQFIDEDKKSLNLGLLYGYEIPANHIQLCDGQQRITTLFLLLGIINKRTNNTFRQHLISDFEYKYDDKEPYLKYSIRESSLYFLSDLVCKFFTKNTDNIEKIKSADWYFRDYDLDPSIQSMIKALSVIEKLLNENELNLKEFGDWLLHKLTFMYVDMENRKNGEETFVIINTTGEPLSATENLKPLIIKSEINKGITNVAEQWEEIETWFWKHRAGDNDTADAGFNEFLRWVTILTSDENEVQEILDKGTYTFPVKSVSFKEIYSYWQSLVFLFENWEFKNRLKKEFLSPATSEGINKIDCFELLPLIEYCTTHKVNDDNQNLYRLYMFLHNLTKVSNVSKNPADLVYDAIQIAKNCEDIIELTDKDLNISRTLLSDEEKKKLSILKENIDNRKKIEEPFWKAQSYSVESHKIWSGEILPLIEWSYDNDGNFDINLFNEYLKKFDETFEGKCDANIDNVRRALLTRNLKEYPRIFRGATNWSFAWKWSDWQTLINDNKQEFKSFFDDLIGGITFEQMIEQYPKENYLAEFVKDPEFMKYCEYKNLQKYNDSWYLMNGAKWSGNHINIHTYKYHLYLNNNKKEFEGWDINQLWEKENTCVFYDQKHSKEPYVSIDIIWNAGKNNSEVEIDLFMKPTDNAAVAESAKQKLKSIAESLDYKWNEDSMRYVKYIDIIANEAELYAIIDKECEQILTNTELCNDSIEQL